MANEKFRQMNELLDEEPFETCTMETLSRAAALQIKLASVFLFTSFVSQKPGFATFCMGPNILICCGHAFTNNIGKNSSKGHKEGCLC